LRKNVGRKSREKDELSFIGNTAKGEAQNGSGSKKNRGGENPMGILKV